MTLYQIYTRLWHFFTARYWRGHGLHSPFMYNFVRETVLGNPRKKLPEKIRELYSSYDILEATHVEELPAVKENMIIMLHRPFLNRCQNKQWKRWYKENHCVAVHLQELLVVFSDKKLQKQFFKIRN